MKSKAYFYGLIAIVSWGSLATLGRLLIHLPPFFILGMSFLIGALPSLRRPKEIFPNAKTTLWGVAGFFLYHFFLFYSFRHAPAIEANLINYLWPMLLVMLSPLFFKKDKLHYYHFIGALLSIVGCAFLVFGKGLEFKMENAYGYLLALGAAITWPIYSLGKKKLPEVSVWAVGGFGFGASALFFLTHSLLEPHVVIQSKDLLLLLLIGAGPMGLSFYAWDKALQLGDPRIVGALSYLTPVLSTLGLIIFTEESMTNTTILAMVLIIGGASTGLLDFLPGNFLKKS